MTLNDILIPLHTQKVWHYMTKDAITWPSCFTTQIWHYTTYLKLISNAHTWNFQSDIHSSRDVRQRIKCHGATFITLTDSTQRAHLNVVKLTLLSSGTRSVCAAWYQISLILQNNQSILKDLITQTNEHWKKLIKHKTRTILTTSSKRILDNT